MPIHVSVYGKIEIDSGKNVNKQLISLKSYNKNEFFLDTRVIYLAEDNKKDFIIATHLYIAQQRKIY